MSRYFSNKFKGLEPYIPGEQPTNFKYLKLNTNESPFPPPNGVFEAINQEALNLQLYSDPECKKLRAKMAEFYGVLENQIIMTNGSDEVLNFAFMAYSSKSQAIVFPKITYGFYRVFAQRNNALFEEIPLKDDLSIDINDYISINKTIVIANPNAPTGLSLSVLDIEKIVKSNPNNVVIIDQAYVDFAEESATALVSKYDNLLVVGTFSKSYSLAGARLGFAIGNEKLIEDLNKIKYSINPYNVNSMTAAAGLAALNESKYYLKNIEKIKENREWTILQLQNLGFKVLNSSTNFVFAKSNKISGENLYLKMKEKGVLIRHFKIDRIKDYNRITIGTKEQMQYFIQTLSDVLKEC